MEAVQRIILNTAVQYVRSLIYMLLTLLSTRYILLALGQSDFGIYSLIGSIVIMFGFITNSLASTTQRFLSYTHGKTEREELRLVFSNAMMLHTVIAVVLLLALFFVGPWVMSQLSIPVERMDAGYFVYCMVVLMIGIIFLTSPLRALFIARENIIFVSVVEVTDAVLRLAGAIALLYIPYDSLKLYGLLMTSLSVFNFVVYLSYASRNYDECCLPRIHDFSKSYIKQLTGFAVWNVYSVGATVVRTQGLAVVINHFFSTLVNAAYGIALQVSHSINFLAVAIINALNPQLMKAEGRRDRKSMLLLATQESKYSYLVLSVVLIPVLCELTPILNLWLKEVPPYSEPFCFYIILAFIIDQTTIGLTSANQAVGQIRNYSLLISTTRLLILPISWLCLQQGFPVLSVMYVYITIEILCGIMRIPFLHYTANLPVWHYLKSVYMQTAITIIATFFVSKAVTLLPNFPFRFILTEFMGLTAGIGIAITTALDKDEKLWLSVQFSKLKERL